MSNSNLVTSLNEALQISIPPKSGSEELLRLLTSHINNMINSNLEQLINLLYRIDVSEQKIREFLANKPGEDAAPLIARLIIERQEQKIKSRQQYTPRDKSIDEEDSW
jgi:hypothetical protein